MFVIRWLEHRAVNLFFGSIYILISRQSHQICINLSIFFRLDQLRQCSSNHQINKHGIAFSRPAVQFPNIQVHFNLNFNIKSIYDVIDAYYCPTKFRTVYTIRTHAIQYAIRSACSINILMISVEVEIANSFRSAWRERVRNTKQLIETPRSTPHMVW